MEPITSSPSGPGPAQRPRLLGGRDQNKAESTGRSTFSWRSPDSQARGRDSVPEGGVHSCPRGTHVALAHEQVLGGGLSSCASQVLAPAELLLLVTWAPQWGKKRGPCRQRLGRSKGGPYPSTRIGKAQGPPNPQEPTRETLLRQDVTWVDTQGASAKQKPGFLVIVGLHEGQLWNGE